MLIIDWMTIIQDFALSWLVKTSQNFSKCGFPTTISPNDKGDISFFEAEI